MATSVDLPSLSVGSVFSSFRDFKTALDKHCDATGYVYSIKGCKTVDNKNKTVATEKGKYPVEWQYITATFQCKHYGAYSSQSSGKRKEQFTFKTGCSARLLLSANKNKGGLVLTEVNLEHSGHGMALDQESRIVYPEHRRLTVEQAAELRTLLSLGIGTAKAIEHMRSTHGVGLLPSDINNMRMKAAAADGQTEQQRAVSFLKSVLASDNSASVDICTDDSGTTSVIFLQTTPMKEVLNQYPDVLFVDSTYRINRRNMPLFVFMVVDGDHCGQVVGYAMVLNESAENVSNLLNIFFKNNPDAKNNVKSVVLDKDFSEVKAVKTVLPSASIVLCKWHVDRAFQRALKGYTTEDRESLMNITRRMLSCSSEQTYESLKTELRSTNRCFWDYFMKNWDNVKTFWAGCFVRHAVTYGNLTNNFVESHNQKIKFVVDANSTLTELIKQLLNITHRSQLKSKVKKSKLMLKKKQVFNNIVPPVLVERAHQLCSPYAARLLTEQLEKLNTVVLIVDGNFVLEAGRKYTTSRDSCTCFCFVTQHVLCCHIMQLRKDDGDDLFQEIDIPSQHKRETYLRTSNAPAVEVQPKFIPSSRRILNRIEKFKAAKRVLMELADVISQRGQKDFDESLDMFKGMTNSLREGKRISWYEGDTLVQDMELPTSVEVLADDVQVEEQNEADRGGANNQMEGPSETGIVADHLELGQEVAHLDSEGNSSVSLLNASNFFQATDVENMSVDNIPFQFPSKIKRKGRPRNVQPKKRKQLTESPVQIGREQSWLKMCVHQIFVESVCRGEMLIDEYVLNQDVQSICDEIVHCDEAALILKAYFSPGAYLLFLNMLIEKRSSLS